MSTNTTTTLDGLFKTVYGEGPVNLLPDFAILSKKVPFRPTEKIGQRFEVPVKLQFEGGFTYGASGDGAYNLNGSTAGKIGRAQVDAYQIVLQSSLDYESAFKAANGGKQAFQDATQAVVENMMESFAKRQELAMIHGQKGLGTISATSVSGNATITFTAATWAPGIWVGMKGAQLDAYNVASKRNTNAVMTIVSVNIGASQIVVSGNGTDLSALAAGDVIYFQGAYGKEMYGLNYIMNNTGSLFNIDASLYELWQSQTYGVSGQISMEKILLGAAQAAPLGLKEKTTLLLESLRWTNLNTDLAALRRSDESYKASGFENGVEGITYHGVTGDMEIVSHPFVKQGEAFLLPEKRIKRVGSTDVTFKRPDNPNRIFLELTTQAGYELRAYSDQQIFVEAPSHCVYFSGITS